LSLSHHDYQLLRASTARAAIHDLTVANGQAYESGDVQAWLNTFTVKGSLVLNGREPIQGHKALGEYFRAERRDGLQVTVDSVVEVDGVTATQRCRVLSLGTGAAGGAVQSVVDYEDTVVFERGRWFFSCRAARQRL
jgi:SnoaL-like protein